ncbi:MAG TPA: hypothetical protein P5270_04495 [Victivallales bacterium]|nr:hypothetical protein [Victivallales bacterium]
MFSKKWFKLQGISRCPGTVPCDEGCEYASKLSRLGRPALDARLGLLRMNLKTAASRA